jgi:hypothetical protein
MWRKSHSKQTLLKSTIRNQGLKRATASSGSCIRMWRICPWRTARWPLCWATIRETFETPFTVGCGKRDHIITASHEGPMTLTTEGTIVLWEYGCLERQSALPLT